MFVIIKVIMYKPLGQYTLVVYIHMGNSLIAQHIYKGCVVKVEDYESLVD